MFFPNRALKAVFAQFCPPATSTLVPTAYITHPSSMLHDMGPYHPECPDRLTAIGDRLISSRPGRLPAPLYRAGGDP
jgi:hypothetical protein